MAKRKRAGEWIGFVSAIGAAVVINARFLLFLPQFIDVFGFALALDYDSLPAVINFYLAHFRTENARETKRRRRESCAGKENGTRTQQESGAGSRESGVGGI